MKNTWLMLPMVVLAGCSRCGSASAPDVTPPKEHELRKHIDVRTALLLIYPEYRGTATLESNVRYQRVMPTLTDASLQAEATRLKWLSSDGGWNLSNLHFVRSAPDTVEIQLPYDPDQLGYLYVSPNSMTSEEFAYYLPRVPASKERFTFDVRYVTSPERARDLVNQAVTLMLGNAQWTLDGGLPTKADAGDAPHDETFVIDGVNGAKIRFERSGGKVFVQYALDTLGN